MPKKLTPASTPGAAIYTRVSGIAQDQNTSHDTQLLSCQAHAAAAGYGVVKHYRETYSGAVLDERGVLMEAISAARRGEFERFIVHALDRASRGEVDTFYWLRVELRRYGVSLESATDTFGDGTLGGELTFFISAALAGEERKKIIARTLSGKRKRAQEGKIPNWALRLYGYRSSGEEPAQTANQQRWEYGSEAAVVRRIFAGVGGAGLSLREVARALNADGVPSATGVAWQACTVRLVLLNPAYKGVDIIWRRKDRHSEPHEPAMWIHLPPGCTPPLVSEEIWERANEILRRNVGDHARNQKHAFLLRGMVTCLGCGRRYSPIIANGRTYYKCASHYRLGAAKCRTRLLTAAFEQLVWATVRDFMLDDGRLREIVAKQADSGAALDEAVSRVERELAALDKQEETLLGLFVAGGALSRAALDKQAHKLATRRAALDAERALLSGQLSEQASRHTFRRDFDGRLASLRASIERIDAALPEVGLPLRIEMLHSLGIAVETDGAQYIIRWRLGVLYSSSQPASHKSNFEALLVLAEGLINVRD